LTSCEVGVGLDVGAPCDFDDDCAVELGELCDPVAGVCYIPDGTIVVGGECIDDVDCASGFCDVDGFCADVFPDGGCLIDEDCPLDFPYCDVGSGDCYAP